MKRPALFVLILVAAWLAGTAAAHAQGQFSVDCTTATPAPGVFPSINAFLQAVGPFNTAVVVKGNCHENVFISNADNFHILADSTVGAAVSGYIQIADSPDGVTLTGLAVTNPYGDGIVISKSKVILEWCSVTSNGGNGVGIYNSSSVEARGGHFNDNGASGFNAFSDSLLNLGIGPVEIRRNKQSGITASLADVSTGGNTLISDTVSGPGVVLLGGARAQFGNVAGPNIIENNPNGGILLRENSELSIWTCCSQSPSVVRKNGKFGIAAGFHSQVTLSGAEVSDNTGPGVDVYAGSQFDFYPGTKNQILRNGNATDPASAGIRVDGNSQAWLRDGDIFQNTGPGILVWTHSSVDLTNINFGSSTGLDPLNTSGIIRCDHTSVMTSDLQGQGVAQGVACPTTGHAPVAR